MSKLLKRNMLALLIAGASLTTILPIIHETEAFAKNGSGNSGSGGGSDSGGSGNSGSGNSGSGHGGSDDGGSGNSGSSGDSDSDGDDSNSNDDNDSFDDNGGNRKDADKLDKKADKAKSRPTVALSLSDQQLDSVLSGKSVVVDQLGRQLEVSVRSVNGQTVVSGKPHGGDAKRNPGPITSISVVSASTLPADDDGTPDQGQGDN